MMSSSNFHQQHINLSSAVSSPQRVSRSSKWTLNQGVALIRRSSVSFLHVWCQYSLDISQQFEADFRKEGRSWVNMDCSSVSYDVSLPACRNITCALNEKSA